jgi:hypothetical protein
MKDKSEVSNIFQCFSKMIETQFDTKISILRSDNGTEYFNKNLKEFLQHKGIQHALVRLNKMAQLRERIDTSLR